jgi:hypothetical protein
MLPGRSTAVAQAQEVALVNDVDGLGQQFRARSGRHNAAHCDRLQYACAVWLSRRLQGPTPACRVPIHGGDE